MYVKDGATQQDWQRDCNDCLVKEIKRDTPAAIWRGTSIVKNFSTCACKDKDGDSELKRPTKLNGEKYFSSNVESNRLG